MGNKVVWVVKGIKDGQPIQRTFDKNLNLGESGQIRSIEEWCKEEGWTDVTITKDNPLIYEEAAKDSVKAHIGQRIKAAFFPFWLALILIGKFLIPNYFVPICIIATSLLVVVEAVVDVIVIQKSSYSKSAKTADIAITIIVAIMLIGIICMKAETFIDFIANRYF